MENCLITKLNGVVNNEKLPKLGEKIFRVIPGVNLNKLHFEFHSNSAAGLCPKRIVGTDAYFVDGEDNNLGKSTTQDNVFVVNYTPGETEVYCDISKADYALSQQFEFVDKELYWGPLFYAHFLFMYDTGSYNYGLSSLIRNRSTLNFLRIIDSGNVVNFSDFVDFPVLNVFEVFMNNIVVGDLVNNFVKPRVINGQTSCTNMSLGEYNYAYAANRRWTFDGNAITSDLLGMMLSWSTTNGVTTVSLASSNQPTLTATFEIS